MWTPQTGFGIAGDIYAGGDTDILDRRGERRHGVWGSGPSDIYAAGEGTAVLHSRGDGAWSSTETGAPATQLEEFRGTGRDDVYLVGANGVILHGTR